ncbi:hypothetical protein FS837_008878 [Tulasnella sp. UAMH 9824]|nr:hypothetical protein FS837_008878 [Tulasnella sp. UAMH 9824]
MVDKAFDNGNPDDITLLSDVLDEVTVLLRDADPQSKRAISAIKVILSEALDKHRRGGNDASTRESSSFCECGAGDTNGNSRIKNLRDSERLYQCALRILNQIRANGLEGDEKWKEIMSTLKARCELTDSKIAKGTSDQAVPTDTLQVGAVKGHHDFSPISFLPVEILQQIFWLAALPHLWIRAPLVLSLVNSHFRSMLLDTPFLWAVVDNTLPPPILRLYLARSRNEPLDVLTKTDHPYSYGDWFDFLKVESIRIKHMAVVGNYPDLLSDWGRELQRDEGFIFTSLSKLAFRVINGNDNQTLCPTWNHFPNLRELWIQGCWGSGWVGPGDPFPPTLRRLRLSSISSLILLELVEALCGVLDLVSLTMEDVGLDPDDLDLPETTSQVNLNFLQELEIVNVQVADIRDIWRYVSTPNLSSFSITSSGPSDEITDLLETFTVKHPQISSLRILGLKLDLQLLKGTLHNLANLTLLHIRASDRTDDDLAALKDGTFFPRLTVVVS